MTLHSTGRRSLEWRCLALAFAVLLAPSAARAQLFGDGSDLRSDIAVARDQPVDEVVRTLEQGDTHPIAMWLLAKRLYDADRRDEAVFWFYLGQLRWRSCLRQTPSCGGREQYGRLFETIGPDLNTHGFRTLPALQSTVDAVVAWDESHPDRFGVDAAIKEQQRQGMREMVAYAQEHSAELAARQEELARIEAARGSDPYGGEGGAIFGMPQELLTAYDADRFRAFRRNVTTRDEVIATLGRPESWSTDERGASTLGYSYLRASEVTAVLGMTERVQVTLEFNAAKVLTRVRLPRD